MTSWASSSNRARALVAALALAAALGGCARRVESAPPPHLRIAIFPIENASASLVNVRDLATRLEVSLRRRGVEVVTGDIVESFLARHRQRYTGGLDGPTALAAKEELEVDAVLVTAVDLYWTAGSPKYGMTMRLVSTGENPSILWMDGSSRAGDEAPGLFNLGLVTSVRELQNQALAKLSDSLTGFLQRRHPGATVCQSDSRFGPRVLFRSPLSTAEKRISIAVLPFVNQSNQANAGDVLSLAFVRTLLAAGWIDVRDPGIVRTELLRHRVVMEGGVSSETARVALGSMNVDVVVSGYVRGYDDGEPRVEFTVIALDTWDNRVVWQSSSYSRGSDGVVLFDFGKVDTANQLACRMVRDVVDEMAGYWAKRRAPQIRFGTLPSSPPAPQKQEHRP
jgi:hypothetical protein